MLLLVPHPPTPPPAHCRSEHNGWGWGDPGSHDWQEVHLLCTGCSYLLVCSEPLASYQRQSAAAGWGGGVINWGKGGAEVGGCHGCEPPAGARRHTQGMRFSETSGPANAALLVGCLLRRSPGNKGARGGGARRWGTHTLVQKRATTAAPSLGRPRAQGSKGSRKEQKVGRGHGEQGRPSSISRPPPIFQTVRALLLLPLPWAWWLHTAVHRDTPTSGVPAAGSRCSGRPQSGSWLGGSWWLRRPTIAFSSSAMTASAGSPSVMVSAAAAICDSAGKS